MLLLSQKNNLFDAIEKAGLSPAQFTYEGVAPINIKSKSSDFYFIIEKSTTYFSRVLYSPGEYRLQTRNNCSSWNENLNYFNLWLRCLKRETQQDDKWSRLEEEIQSLDFNYSNDDTKFSASDFDILQLKFETLKLSFAKMGLGESQLLTLNSKLDYLLIEAKHMNRFDWKSLFVGTIISIIITLSITHEQGLEIWKVIREVFNNFLLNQSS